MNSKKLTYEEMESSISEFLKDCKSIRADRQKDYGFHFLTNYNKYGLKGFLINDGEITARMEQMEKSIEDGTTCFIDKEKSLQNALYDGINYRLLLLFWMNREKWQAQDPHTHEINPPIWPQRTSNDSMQGNYPTQFNTTETCKCAVKNTLPTEADRFVEEIVEKVLDRLMGMRR
jgi:hypothetical protein